MPSFAALIQQGSAHAWLFIPSAILLGALHGLEPGHSKTMMAAFIIAVRGTVKQAILLGIAATISHTIIVWAIALGGLYIWQGLDAESIEPYFQLASAAVIIAIALWMMWRTWKDQQLAAAHDHDHAHDGHHHHGEELRRIDTGHGVVTLEIFEEGQPPRWRFKTLSGDTWHAHNITVETERPDGTRQKFTFRDRSDYLESFDDIPEPHEFKARVTLLHGDHGHDYDLSFTEGQGHDGDSQADELQLATAGYQDAHEMAHASDIQRKFAGQRQVTTWQVTTWQVIGFGLTGGLIPCPAAITVLLLCLQLKQIPLGAVLVLCFSIGLAITLVAVGVTAALAVKHASQRISWFSTVARRAPYVSSGLIILVGLYVGYQGWAGLVALASKSA